VLQHFDDFVERVVKVTAAMKKSKFNAVECAEILDYYYSDDWENPDIYPSQNENYYYALRIPQLRAAELALEALSRPDMWNMDVTAARRKLQVSKLKLWQALPDFYKGHANPMSKPLSYKAARPYPHLCSEESLVDHEDRKLQRHWRAIEMQTHFEAYLPDIEANRVAHLTVINPVRGNPVVKSDNGLSILIDYSTWDAPSVRFLDLVESIMANDDPGYMSYDPEGPNYHIVSARAAQHNLVRLLVINEGYEEKIGLVTGLFNRREAAAELMTLGGITECDLSDEQLATIPIRIKKLKEMM
jgi:hypothetical protein